MTYEPGQQVLVRGVVRSTRQQLADDRGWIRVEVDSLRLDGHILFATAADVVGPAPATPDEGDWQCEYHKREIARVWTEYHGAKLAQEAAEKALAAAEARIHATLEMHKHSMQSDWCLGCNQHYPCVTRRALSVEATDTEGGGGHE